ncbi:hypothetical protein ONZ45_g11183 [Pleurotus djamor]|nr:hypothetical protein ONZ45_g11183 [Pleurotus djamor]
MMGNDAVTKLKDAVRSPRGSKRSSHAAFHVESSAGPSREPIKNVSNEQPIHSIPRHRKSDRNISQEVSSTAALRELGYPTASTSKSPSTQSPQPLLKKKDHSSASLRQQSSSSSHAQRHHRTKAQTPIAVDNPHADRRSTTWQTMQEAESEALKKEVDELKRAMLDCQRMMKKQNKVGYISTHHDAQSSTLHQHIKELNAQLANANQAKKEQDIQYQHLKTKASQQDDLINTIEASLQCQICMDMISKPQALSPCGHVFCLSCLQAWFRKAPSVDEDLDAGMTLEYIMNRPKSCPFCRASVIKKPAPLFILRDISIAITKAKTAPAPAPAPVTESDDCDDNPWKGIFPPSDDEENDDNNEPHSYDYEPDFMDEYAVHSAASMVDTGMLDMFMGHWGGIGISSDSDLDDPEELEDLIEENGSEEEGEDQEYDREDIYVPMRWEPPYHGVPEDFSYSVSNEVWKLLRRGCTPLMIQKYNMRYTHEQGITAIVQNVRSGDLVIPGRLTIYLGWNLSLNPEDRNGEAFITDMLTEMSESPERWLLDASHRSGDSWEAHRLISVSEVDSEEYESTESELYDEM